LGLCFALWLTSWAGSAAAREVPPLSGRVVDTVSLLSPADRARIDALLEAYERSSGHQFAVLIIDSLSDDSLEGFSIRVVETWQLGKKKVDDGLLLLVVRDDRKTRIEVGYGLEGTITDAVSSRVIREVLTPAFRAQDYARGIEQALLRLMHTAGGVPEGAAAPEVTERRGGRSGAPSLMLILVAAFFFLPVLLASLFRGGKRGRQYGRRGGGFFVGGFPIGMGGGRSGGFGGGSFGGGGFSGGGGGFGGGGASGSW
jgi:uncharacterized protein